MSREECLQDLVNTYRNEGREIYRKTGIKECKILKQKLENLDVEYKEQIEIVEKLPNLQPRDYVWQQLNDYFVEDIIKKVNNLKAYKTMMNASKKS